ncbi:CASP-like protein 1B1 [Bienertia sinuspersici]
MAEQRVEKSDVGYNSLGKSVRGNKNMATVLPRVVCLLATLAATIVMVLNKETKTIVVATIGTSSIKATLSAKWQNTPANM